MKIFFTRVISGIIYVIVILTGIMWNRYSFFLIFSTITFFSLKELYNLMNINQKTIISLFHCFGGVILFTSTYLFVSGTFSFHIFWLYLFYIVSIFISQLFQQKQNSIMNISYILFGQFYIVFPLTFLNIIAFNNHLYTSKILLILFISIWIHDSTSYFFGMKFGKHYLSKHISPKKSWEGTIAGFIFTLFCFFICSRFIPTIPFYHWINMSIIISIFATCGDLVESLIKRTWNIKDSGKIIPGHGGILDRFDSLLLTIYIFCFYLKCFIT